MFKLLRFRAIPFHAVFLFLVLGLLVGCSTDSGILSPLSETQNTTEFRGPVSSEFIRTSFPPLTEEQLAAGPAPGWEFMHMDPTAVNGKPQGNLDSWWNGEPIFGSRWMQASRGGTLWVEWYGCRIPAHALPYDCEVSVYAENPGWAVADFGPHPMQFNQNVEFWIDCIHLVYDDDFDFNEDIGLFYIPEDGEPVMHPFWIDMSDYTVHGITNHFSRYILASRTIQDN